MDKGTVIETKIDQFHFKVCNSFKPKLRNDQLCYEFDPSLYVEKDNKDHIKHGLYLIVDENKDRQMDFMTNEASAEEYFHDIEQVVDKEGGIQIFLDAIGRNRRYFSCTYGFIL